jgi:4-amino-4-deoxy-L-arabinose transferase-like glycosyltransferase
MPVPSFGPVSGRGGGANPLFTSLTLAAILALAAWLRFVNLGYSDFQGDEIKALVQLSGGESFVEFLLRQRKPPGQWFITYIYGLFDPQYSNHLLLRLPFAIASVSSVFALYLLTRIYFGYIVASVAALFMAASGLFVAFGRIVQHQSITMLLILISLLLLSLAIKRDGWKLPGLYLGMICGGLALLTHFDSVCIIFPASLLIFWWYKKYRSTTSLAWTNKLYVFVAIILFIFIVLSFYIPFLWSLTEYQFSYWNRRMTGEASNSINILLSYNFSIVLIIQCALIIISLFSIKRHSHYLFLFSWLLPSLFFLEFVMSDPRSHIYVYMLPLFIFAGLGFEAIFGMAESRFIWGRRTIAVGLLVAGLFSSFAASHYLFVDHDPEFPWNNKKILGVALEGKEFAGIMGFPYRRDWRAIAEVLGNLPDRETSRFVSNEGSTVTQFYLQDTMAELSRNEIRVPSAVYLIAIKGARTWRTSILGRPLDYWRSRQDLTQVSINDQAEIILLSRNDIAQLRRQ